MHLWIGHHNQETEMPTIIRHLIRGHVLHTSFLRDYLEKHSSSESLQ